MTEQDLDPTVVELANLAMEIEMDVNIDWAALGASREQIFTMMSKNVYDQFNGMENQDEAAVVALATIVKLLVENFGLKNTIRAKG